MNIAPDMPRTVAIIGGGITGMAAAYAVREEAVKTGAPLRFVLVESADRLGGKIITEQVDGFTVEGGPDCFIRQKPWAGELAQKLGLGDALTGTNDHQRKVYVVNRGKMTPLPDGVMLIVPTRIMPFVTSPLISWPGKIRMGLDLFIPPFKGEGDESVGDFVRRRLGSEALDKIAEPLMGGIHVSDPEQQSLLGTFPRFRGIEKKHGSLIKGMLAERKAAAAAKKKQAAAPPARTPQTIFLSFQGGMGQLVDALAAAIQPDLWPNRDDRIILGVKVLDVQAQPGGYRLSLSNGEVVEADAVVMAAPAFVTGSLIESMNPTAARLLRSIRYVSTATVSLGYRVKDLRKPFMGFGFVVPKKENRRISACTWSSYKFNHRAPDGTLLLRCFVGGPGKEEQVELSDEEIYALVQSELNDLLQIDAEPVVRRIYRWRQANPQYDVGHPERVKEIHALLQAQPGVFIAGGAYEGVGVPDCIRQGSEAARKAAAFCRETGGQAVITDTRI